MIWFLGDWDWVLDVVYGVIVWIEGQIVILENVCNFEWCSEQYFILYWEMCCYDIGVLFLVDLVILIWGNLVIVYMLISFGFFDGVFLIFLVEIW